MGKNGHAHTMMPTADEHRMHQHLRRARAALSPSTAPDLSDCPAPSNAPVPFDVAEACIDADYHDVRRQLKAIADELTIQDGDSAATICERLRRAIEGKLEALAEGRVKDVHVGTTPMRRDKWGQWRNGHKIVVTEYFG